VRWTTPDDRGLAATHDSERTLHATLKALGAEGEPAGRSTYLAPPAAGQVGGASRRVFAGGEGAAGVDARVLGLRILRALPVVGPARSLERLLAPLTHPAHRLFSALGEVPRVGRLAAHAEVVKVGRRGAGAGRRLVSSAAVCSTTGHKRSGIGATLRTTGAPRLAHRPPLSPLRARVGRPERPTGSAYFLAGKC